MDALTGSFQDKLTDHRSVRETRQSPQDDNARMTAAAARMAWLWLALYGIVFVGSAVANFKHPQHDKPVIAASALTR